MMTDKKLKEILTHWELKEPVKLKTCIMSQVAINPKTLGLCFSLYICSLLLDIM